MWVGGHFEAGVRHQETGDVGEAGVDVFTYILQLFVLILWDLHRKHDHTDHVLDVLQFGSAALMCFCKAIVF